MKIQFDADLDYQAEAIRAVCDLFEGQEVCNTLFTVAADSVFSARRPPAAGDQARPLH